MEPKIAGQKRRHHDDSDPSTATVTGCVKRHTHTTLDIYPPRQFDISFPFFRKPQRIGYFSISKDRRVHFDQTHMKFYKEPQPGDRIQYNLREGFESHRSQDPEVKERLDLLLTWIMSHRDKFQIVDSTQKGAVASSVATHNVLNTDFVLWRGHLTKIMCTPYSRRDAWRLGACRYHGTIYISEVEMAESRTERLNRTQRQTEMCYWGYKFEQYLTTGKPGGETDTQAVVDSREQLCVVVRSRLNSHSLVYSGEVDCFNHKSSKQFNVFDCSMVELKTSREIDHPRQMHNFKKFKLIKWWAQSFLIGVDEIVAGFRSDEGVVERLDTFKTLKIPKIIKDEWKPNVCMNFCDAFLKFVKNTIKTDDHRTVYMFEYNPAVCESVQYWSHVGEMQHCFLPDWYTDPQQAHHPTPYQLNNIT